MSQLCHSSFNTSCSCRDCSKYQKCIKTILAPGLACFYEGALIKLSCSKFRWTNLSQSNFNTCIPQHFNTIYPARWHLVSEHDDQTKAGCQWQFGSITRQVSNAVVVFQVDLRRLNRLIRSADQLPPHIPISLYCSHILSARTRLTTGAALPHILS